MARMWKWSSWARAAMILALLLAPRSGTSQAPAKRTTVITMEKARRGVKCTVDSKSFDDLLSAYGNVLERYGPDHPVAVLIDDRLPLSWIWAAPTLASKAPLTNIRVFVAIRENEKMFEIQRTPSVPLTTPIE